MSDARILIIKLGAFGNVVLAMNAFAAIRAFHATARISLLTTAPYAEWLRQAPWFDEVLLDARPAWWNPLGVWRLRQTLTRPHFNRVYDLQTSGRSSYYFRLLPRSGKPEWCGIVASGSHPDRAPNRSRMHDLERLAGQLGQAGITSVPQADLSWCRGAIARFGLQRDFVVLVPGSAAHRPDKRWPAAHYQALAVALRDQGLTPVVVGAKAEAAIAREIPAAVNLIGQTSFGDLADLGRAARFAVGNDTGPTHWLAAVGSPVVALFSHASDPALCAPRGPDVRVLRRPALRSLQVAEVLAALPHPVAA